MPAKKQEEKKKVKNVGLHKVSCDNEWKLFG